MWPAAPSAGPPARRCGCHPHCCHGSGSTGRRPTTGISSPASVWMGFSWTSSTSWRRTDGSVRWSLTDGVILTAVAPGGCTVRRRGDRLPDLRRVDGAERRPDRLVLWDRPLERGRVLPLPAHRPGAHDGVKLNAVGSVQDRDGRPRPTAATSTWLGCYAAAMIGQGDRTERLLEAGLALSSELSLPVILQRIVDLAVDLTGARYGALGVLGRDGTITQFITAGVTEEQRAAIGHLPVGRGILGVLIEEATPLRLRDIAADPRSVGLPPNHPPMRSFLGAPVSARGLVFGNLYLTEKQDAAAFTDQDERALVMLAGQAGVAIENARLFEEARDRARRL